MGNNGRPRPPRIKRNARRRLRRFFSSMPVALKEWAVTVRALAEGEQLITLRKGGIREENKHFEIEHDRFFLYPTFDHQRNDLIRQSHVPELDRALEEGVWPENEPPAEALIREGGIPQPERVRIRAWAEVAGELPDHRPSRYRRPFAVLHLDHGLRREATGLEASPSTPRDGAAHIPHPAAGHGQGAAGVPRLPLLAGAVPRAPVRGHAGALGRRVRAGVRADRGDRFGRGAGSGL